MLVLFLMFVLFGHSLFSHFFSEMLSGENVTFSHSVARQIIDVGKKQTNM